MYINSLNNLDSAFCLKRVAVYTYKCVFWAMDNDTNMCAIVHQCSCFKNEVVFNRQPVSIS